MFLKINEELNCLQSAFSLKIRRVLILAIECLQNNNVAKKPTPSFLAARGSFSGTKN